MIGIMLALNSAFAFDADPLPSWNDGAAKKAILNFVAKTKEEGPSYVPPAERIVVFDNDGTLWPEQPMYVQLAFAIDRIKKLAPKHPEWKNTQPFKAVIEGDLEGLKKIGTKGVVELIMTSHAGMSAEDFDKIVKEWIATARHPRFNLPYTRLAYQPMLELLRYLRANSFKTFIVSGGGVEFIRPWAEKTYGIPPEQVVGSSIKLKYEDNNNKPEIIRLSEINFIDDGAGKPVGIQMYIGRRPIAAFGNSDGDVKMLEWTTSGNKQGLGILVHHDDEKREWAYDRQSDIGKLDKGLNEAQKRGWTVVSMKNDWRKVFSFEDKQQDINATGNDGQ